jgi:hypothetical protein
MWVVCRPVWVNEACQLFLVPSQNSNTPLYLSKCCELRSVPQLFPLLLFCTWTHFWVLQGVESASTYPWGCSLFGHDQTLRWSSSHCHNGNVVSIHKPHFMLSILWCVCNTFFPTPIQNNNQGWMWNNGPWHQVHLGPSFQLGCFLARCDKCLQFSVKKIIFQKLCVIGGDIIQLIPFICSFYAFESPLIYNHLTMMATSWSSHLPLELIKVIFWEGHYLPKFTLKHYVL